MNDDARVETLSARVDSRVKSLVESAVQMGDAENKSQWLADAVVWKLQRENVPKRIKRIMRALDLQQRGPDLFSVMDEMEAQQSGSVEDRDSLRPDGNDSLREENE